MPEANRQELLSQLQLPKRSQPQVPSLSSGELQGDMCMSIMTNLYLGTCKRVLVVVLCLSVTVVVDISRSLIFLLKQCAIRFITCMCVSAG